jgi:hypothetical protein
MKNSENGISGNKKMHFSNKTKMDSLSSQVMFPPLLMMPVILLGIENTFAS